MSTPTPLKAVLKTVSCKAKDAAETRQGDALGDARGALGGTFEKAPPKTPPKPFGQKGTATDGKW